MEAIGFAIGVLGPLESSIRDLKKRLKNYRDAPGKLDEIRDRFQLCDASLSTLQGMLDRGWPRGFPEENEDICKNNISCISKLASSCKEQVEDLLSMQFSIDSSVGCCNRTFLKARRATRANRVMEALERLDGDSVKIESFCQQLNGLLGQAYQAANLLTGALVESFVPMFHVPRLPGLEVLDFSSVKTPEGQLKHLLLNDNSGVEQVAAALGGGERHSVPLPGAVGMAGVGKTVALIGLGHDHDIRAHFSDGVHFLSFGLQAVASEVIAGMARFVRDSGGVHSAKAVESCSKLDDAIHKAAVWFSGRTCLFLCDDLWRSDGRAHGFLPDIRHLLDTNLRSKVVISTRDRTIADLSSQQVIFQPKNVQSELSLCMLLRHAGLTLSALQEYGDEAESLSQKILLLCGGLPIALAVAGKLFGRYRERSSKGLICALRLCLARLEKGMGDARAGAYSSVNAAISASLDFLEKDRLNNPSSIAVSDGKTIPHLFEAICVMKNQAQLPITILQRLWDLSRDDSVLLTDWLADLSIITQHMDEMAVPSDVSEVSISVHDLVLVYTKNMAQRSGREQEWHQKLLNSYQGFASELNRADDLRLNTFDVSIQSARPWWDVESDDYIRKNLAWHLVNGGFVKELCALVTDMRWTKFRFKNGGLPELENDFDMLEVALENGEGVVGRKNQAQEFSGQIRILRNALRVSWGSIHRNPRELGFQLYGRLIHHSDSSDIIRKFLNSIEKWHERPWLRPWHGKTTEASERMVMELRSQHFEAVAWAPDEKRILYCDSSALVAFNLVRREESFRARSLGFSKLCCPEDIGIAVGSLEGNIFRWNLETNTQIGETLKGYAEVRSVAISADGRVLISGSEDGSVALWHFEDDKAILKCRRNCSDPAPAVSISGKGERAVSSSGNAMTVWEGAKMTPVCVLHRHKSQVKSVSMGKSGQHVVSGSDDGCVILWNLDKQEQMGHTLFEYSHGVAGVSMSRNGGRVAACFFDGTARVWDMSTLGQIGAPFRMSTPSGGMVALNGDGSRMILRAGGNICLFDVSADAGECDRVGAHCAEVSHLAYCPETRMIASASRDGTLRIWDATTGRSKGKPFSVPSINGYPVFLVMSGNGKKLAAAFGCDGSVTLWTQIRVWDVDSQIETGKIEMGYSVGIPAPWMSRHGTYIATPSYLGDRDDKKDWVEVWDTINRTQIVPAPKTILDTLEQHYKSRKDSSEQKVEILQSACGEWSLSVGNGPQIVVNGAKGKFVLGSLSDSAMSWIVHQSTQGEQSLVVGGSSGAVHWFTLEM